MTTGYSLRHTPTVIDQLNDGSFYMTFNINRPKRRSFNDWMADLEKLSGKRDVSQELTHEEEQEAFAESYALNECAEGRHREDHPNDPTET